MTSESRASTANSSLTYHRIIEAFKFGFSWRAHLGDPAFNNDTSEVGLIMSSCLFKFVKRRRYITLGTFN